MVNLPAICDNCGFVFRSGFAGGGGSTITVIGSKSGPCPRCGSMGSVPDGTYRMIEDMIEVLSASDRTIDELRKLSILVDSAKRGELSQDEVKMRAKEEIPELHPLLDWIVPRNREERFNFGMVILGVILPLIISAMTNSSKEPNIDIDVVVNNIYKTEQVTEMPRNVPIRVNKIGRNEMCPCGSVLKYKRCHGIRR